MIIRLLLAAAVLYGIYRFVKTVQGKPPQQRRGYYTTLLISLGAAGLILLSLTGRVHWIAGLIGAAMPFVRQFAMHYLQRRLNSGDQQHANTPASSKMSRAQALSILGLKDGASEDEIIQAHRHLMQKLHPDRGGNDFLAAQLNEAKFTLLG